jgi:hypothetical protein
MDKARTYRKTAKGAEAMATRDRALPPRLRSLLIFVDGKRTNDELARMAPVSIEEAMDQLLELGLVEAAEPAPGQPLPKPPAPAPVAAAPAAGTVSLVEAQRFAVRRLSDLLGPGSDDVCMRIERAKSAGEFMAALQRAEQLVDGTLGSTRAREFTQDMQGHLPA